MKISELLVESQQLDEGPILNKIGSAVGKGVGAVAKGVGAVAGGVAGLGTAVKKGFQAGKATVGGADDDAEPATVDKRNILQKVRDTMPGSKSTTGTTAGVGTAQATQEPPAADTDGGTAQTIQQSPAQKKRTSAFGKLSAAAAGQPTDDASAGGGTVYAQVKANIDKLDKKGKQRILGLLQKEVGAAPATPKPTPGAGAGAGAMNAMAGQLAKGGAKQSNTMANASVSKTNTAKPGNPNAASQPDDMADVSDAEIAKSTAAMNDERLSRAAGKTNLNPRVKASVDAEVAKRASSKQPEPAPAAEPTAAPVTTPVKQRTGGRVKGQLSQDPRAVKRREANAAKQQATEPKKKPAAPSQAEMDADRERIMGPTSDSIIRTRPMMVEGFSLFRKR